MYKRMKMLLGGLILSTGLVVSTPVSYAAETQVRGEEDIELAYENMGECRAEISISSNQAKCTTVVQRKNKKTVHISMYLQKYTSGSWRKVTGWDVTLADGKSSISKTYAVKQGKYRILSTIKIGSESVTKTSKTVTN